MHFIRWYELQEAELVEINKVAWVFAGLYPRGTPVTSFDVFHPRDFNTDQSWL